MKHQLTGGIYLGGMMLLSPLTLALAYTYAQDNPTRQINYFIVTFSVKYLPYVMLLTTFVMASPAAALEQSTGLVAAHLYYFLTTIWPQHGAGRQVIRTPQIVKGWFATSGGTPQQRGAGTAFAARPQAAGSGSASVPQRQTGSGGGWASGLGGGGGGSWTDRGQGRRLGGD